MENRGLLFIPDISGFTRFVNQTEIEHSRLIIQELLEILIASNQLGLEVSEIEGDAILFYKYGDPPSLAEIYKQVEAMFCAFHKNLMAYDHTKYCQCKACITAADLTLKVISHYGEFTGYSVQKFHKLIGKDIIVAHQLLKNEIPQHEYWLVTKSLVKEESPSGFAEWMQWNSSAKQMDEGQVAYHFTQLGALKADLTTEPMPVPDLTIRSKVLSMSRDYDTDIITLFHATGDFNNRSNWQDGVTKVEEINHYLPRVGMKYRSIHENGEAVIYSSSYLFGQDHIEFTETNATDQSVMRFILDKVAENKTRLTIERYIDKKVLSVLKFRLFEKSKMEAAMKRSLEKLEKLSREIVLTG